MPKCLIKIRQKVEDVLYYLNTVHILDDIIVQSNISYEKNQQVPA